MRKTANTLFSMPHPLGHKALPDTIDAYEDKYARLASHTIVQLIPARGAVSPLPPQHRVDTTHQPTIPVGISSFIPTQKGPWVQVNASTCACKDNVSSVTILQRTNPHTESHTLPLPLAPNSSSSLLARTWQVQGSWLKIACGTRWGNYRLDRTETCSRRPLGFNGSF